jgi:SAM-dependent methyltransferase
VSGATSAIPLPPDELIDRVVTGFTNDLAEENRALFLDTGRRSLGDLERALAAVCDTLSAHDRILDFGCGCGRIVRWMKELADGRTIAGTDIDARAIAWASSNLSFARFEVNEALPPTRYRDGEFDLIVNHSVFTHLDERHQDLWLAELERITAPGGALVLSVHGAYSFQATERELEPGSILRREWRARLERDGILHVTEDSFIGSSFPDFYHTTFHAPWYVLEHWSRWFEVLAYLPRSSLGHQDQVVLRRRGDADEGVAAIRARPRATAEPPGAAPHAPPPTAPPAALPMPIAPSRFGYLGLLARRAIFRAARPVLHAQGEVDRSFAEAISALAARPGERMPPLVGVALRQQAERIDRLERELQELRGSAD